MALEVGKKCLCLPDGRGGYTAYEISAPAVGEKCILLPDGKGGYIAVGTGAPSVGDKVPVVPDGKGGYITWKPGLAFPALMINGSTLYRTSDGCKTFTTLTNSAPNVNDSIENMIYLGNNTIIATQKTIYNVWAGTYRWLPYRSTNLGASWTLITDLIFDYPFQSVIISISEGMALYFISSQASYGHTTRVYKTIDYGATWTLKQSIDSTSSAPNNVAHNGAGAITICLYSSTNNLYVSTDYGETWTGHYLSSNEPSGVCYIDTDEILVYFYAGANNIYRSTNAGVTWSLVGEIPDFMDPFIMCSPQPGWCIGNPFGENRMYLSEDSGETWESIIPGYNINRLYYSTKYKQVVAVGAGAVLMSGNSCDDFTLRSTTTGYALAFID